MKRKVTVGYKHSAICYRAIAEAIHKTLKVGKEQENQDARNQITQLGNP